MLRRQTSLPPLDFSSSSRGTGSRRVYAYNCDEYYGQDPLDNQSPTCTPKKTSMRDLWKKIMKKKTQLLHPGHVSVSGNCERYDAETYAQNFDQGEAAVEPENLYRSFSARFVVPARDQRGLVLQRVASERQKDETNSWF